MTYRIDEKFMVGPGIMVTPVLQEGITNIQSYFPEAYWYSIDGDDSRNVINNDDGSFKQLPAAIDYINVHIRGGHIIPMQDHANTTEYARKTPFSLYIATDEYDEAIGELFYDDGVSQKLENFFFARYSLRGGKISNEIEVNNYSDMKNLKLNVIRIFYEDFVLDDYQAIQIKPKTDKPNIKVECKDQYCELVDLNFKMDELFEIELIYNTVPSKKETMLIDCLPWMKNKNEIEIEKECLKRYPECLYDQTEGNKDAPYCFLADNLPYGNVTQKIDTNLGQSLTIDLTKNNLKNEIKIDFEYLDNLFLRFKVIINI